MHQQTNNQTRRGASDLVQVGHSHPSGPRFGKCIASTGERNTDEAIGLRLRGAEPTISSRLIRRFNWSIAKLYRYAKRVEPERGRGWSLVL